MKGTGRGDGHGVPNLDGYRDKPEGKEESVHFRIRSRNCRLVDDHLNKFEGVWVKRAERFKTSRAKDGVGGGDEKTMMAN